MDAKTVDPANPAVWGAFVVVFMCVMVGIFDFVALYSEGKLVTISSILQAWAKDYPMVGVVCGIIIGHLFFPTHQAHQVPK